MWQVRVVIYISPSSQTKTAPSTLRHWQIQWNRKSKGSQKIYELTGQKFESGENLVLWKTSVIPGRPPFYLWNYHFLRFRKVKVYICLCTYIYIYTWIISTHHSIFQIARDLLPVTFLDVHFFTEVRWMPASATGRLRNGSWALLSAAAQVSVTLQGLRCTPISVRNESLLETRYPQYPLVMTDI